MTLAPPPIIKGQFGLTEGFGTDPFQVWYNVFAALEMHLAATDPLHLVVAEMRQVTLHAFRNGGAGRPLLPF